jgi:predicted nucleic acid-binding protein
MAIVIDASMALAWVFPDERDDDAVAAGRCVARERAVVPALWRWEVQNVLRNAEKRGRLGIRQLDDVLDSLRALRILVDAPEAEAGFGAELQLARRFSLSVYDAAYLELAVRRALLLATKDEALASAASQMGLLWRR